MTKTQTMFTTASLMAWTFTAALAEDPGKLTVWGENAPDWTVDVAGWKAVAANEHPRLIYRKSDLARLKQRAATPEGKVILARMKTLLDGKFTLWHPAAYGLLYQLTGEADYAGKAKKACEDIIDAKARDKDDRYGFENPGSGGPMRAGPAIPSPRHLCPGALAAGYTGEESPGPAGVVPARA